jgi:hypothetical protein
MVLILGALMMLPFELSHYRRANVWLDEVPSAAAFSATSVVTRLVKARGVVDASHRLAAVELYIPHGPQVSYALLGAELLKADVDGLEVQVSVNRAGFRFQRSLAWKLDEVKVGLLEEYANSVISGAVKVAEAIGAPTKAALRFGWAAHGLVGSSSYVFEKASEIVLQLVMLPKGVSNDEIRRLFG